MTSAIAAEAAAPLPRHRAVHDRRGACGTIARVVRVLVGVLLAAAALAASAQPRVALVIGNAEYTHVGALRNPVNDATDMARTLQGLGFDVTLRTNLAQRDFNRALTAFGEKIKPGTVALFYFAGHGIQFRGQNFLIPVDAQIPQEQAVRTEGLDVDRVLDQFQNASIGLVILDACRNNPFERAIRSGGGGGLAKVEAPKGMLIAFSTAPGRVAEDGTNTRNSPYTGALVRALAQPERPVETVFKEVRREVGEATANRQLPWETSSLTGDFFFRTPTLATGSAPVPSVGQAPAAEPTAAAGGPGRDAELAVELAFFDSIKNSTQAADYEAYLTQYPQGRFAVLARARLRALGGSAAPVAAAAAGAGAVVATRPASPSPPSAASATSAATPATPVRRLVYRIDDVHWRQQRDVALEISTRDADRTEFNGGRRVEAPAGRTRGAVEPALRLGLLDAYQPPAGWVPATLTEGLRFRTARYEVEGRCELQLDGRVLAARPAVAPVTTPVVPIEYTGSIGCAVGGATASGGTFWPVRFVISYAPELGRIVRAEFDGAAAPAAQLRFRELLSLQSID